MKTILSLPFISLFFFLCFTKIIICNNSSNAFILTIQNEKAELISPKEYINPLPIIIKNLSPVKIRGEILSHDQKVIKTFAIRASKNQSFSIPHQQDAHYYLMILSPPYPQFNLRKTRNSYEYPFQKK